MIKFLVLKVLNSKSSQNFQMMAKSSMIVALFILLVAMPGLFAEDDNSTKDVFSLDASIDDNWFADIAAANNNNGDNDDDEGEDFDDETNSTLCSNLSSNDFSNGCQFWMQGVLLCVVGFGGVIGNSVMFLCFLSQRINI